MGATRIAYPSCLLRDFDRRAGVKRASAGFAAGAANRNKNNTFCFILGLIFRIPARFFGPSEQKVDPAFDVRILVLLKTQLRYMPEAQSRSQFMPKKAVSMFQGGHRLLDLFITTPNGDDNIRVTAIGTDMNVRDFDRRKTRVAGFKADDFREFFADRFGNP